MLLQFALPVFTCLTKQGLSAAMCLRLCTSSCYNDKNIDADSDVVKL